MAETQTATASDGVWRAALSSSQRLQRVALVALFGVALWAVQAFLENRVDPYNQQIIILAGVSVILAVSLNLINGVTGQFSLGHAGFMAVGAYTSAAFSFYVGPQILARSQSVALANNLIFIIALLIGALCAALAGLIVGLPSLRLRGDYLAIVTLGFGQIIVTIIRTIKEVGDASGFTNLPRLTTPAWVCGLVVACILCMRNLSDSALGRSMRAVREDEVAAEAAGVDTTRVKVLAFVISSMWAGIAGVLQAHYLQLAHPDQFSFVESIRIVVMVVLGGLGSITGSATAAVLLRVLEERLRDAPWAFGCGLVLVVLAVVLSFAHHKKAIQSGGAAAIRALFSWLLWPFVSTIALCLIYFRERAWVEANVASLRFIIYALILIVLMLLRPQGLLGRGEFGWHLFRRRSARDTSTHAPDEPADEGVAGTL